MSLRARRYASRQRQMKLEARRPSRQVLDRIARLRRHGCLERRDLYGTVKSHQRLIRPRNQPSLPPIWTHT